MFVRLRMKKFFDRLRKFAGPAVAAGIGAGLLVVLVGLLVVKMPAAESRVLAVTGEATPPLQAHRVAPRFADLRGERAADDVLFIADWVADSRDAADQPFVIIDKKGAHVYVFDSGARLLGVAPVLLGAAPGDDTVPGIGDRPLSQVLPHERTTPAGRFVGERGHNARGEDVVWVDYDAAVSMHRVLTTNPQERRLERSATPTVDDNRVSFGCINVPVAFYEKFLRPTFAEHTAIIYVLPEFKSAREVFAAYDVAARYGLSRTQVQRAPDSDALMMLLFALRSS
jgi:hypothetical protein